MDAIVRPKYAWKIGRNRTLALGHRTLIMGIVNLTPDSFSDGGQFASPQQAIDHALRLLDEGADLLDLGAESTRPGAILTLTPEQEQQRLAPVLKGILRLRPEAILSVDTFHASTARFVVEHGASVINDVSAMTWDEQMPATLASLDCGLVLMHTRGKPADWATQTPLADDEVTPLVVEGLQRVLSNAHANRLAADRIVLDPGFGFGKRGAENFTLLHHLGQLHALGHPLLIGLSRKGFLAPHREPKDRVTATLAANNRAILQGAHLLRVHDVAEALRAAQQADALLDRLASA